MTARTPERSISPRRPSCRWAAICRSSARTAASTAGTERWGWGNSGVRASPPPPPHLTLGQHLFLHVVIFAEVDVRFDVSEGLRCGVGVSTDSPRVPDPPAKPPKAPTWVRVSPHCWYSRPSSPSICRSACCRCASVSAWMRSRSPSAAVRSSFPRWNARRVNSPGSAGRSPERRPESGHQHREGWGGWGGGGTHGDGGGKGSPSARSTPLTTAGPPCTCSSAQSSPVKLWGPAVHGERLQSHRDVGGGGGSGGVERDPVPTAALRLHGVSV